MRAGLQLRHERRAWAARALRRAAGSSRLRLATASVGPVSESCSNHWSTNPNHPPACRQQQCRRLRRLLRAAPRPAERCRRCAPSTPALHCLWAAEPELALSFCLPPRQHRHHLHPLAQPGPQALPPVQRAGPVTGSGQGAAAPARPAGSRGAGLRRRSGGGGGRRGTRGGLRCWLTWHACAVMLCTARGEQDRRMQAASEQPNGAARSVSGAVSTQRGHLSRSLSARAALQRLERVRHRQARRAQQDG